MKIKAKTKVKKSIAVGMLAGLALVAGGTAANAATYFVGGGVWKSNMNFMTTSEYHHWG